MNKSKVDIMIRNVPVEHHKELKSKLALLGQNVSEWVREKIKEFLES